MKDNKAEKMEVRIAPAKMQTACFTIKGTAPLVVHRFSKKVADGLLEKMKAGSTTKKGKARQDAERLVGMR